MVKRSWFYQNGLFTTLLVLVLLVHIILLIVEMHKDYELGKVVPNTSVPGPPIKTKLLTDSEYRTLAKKQIVQSQDPSMETKPKTARFLSDKNRQFDRQTLARKVDSFNTSGKGNGPRDISLADLAAFDKTHNPIEEGLKSLAQARKKSASSQQVAGTEAGSAASRGVSSTNDYIEDIPLGDTTYLNTVEYKYYGFFHRIRQKLEQFWGRSIQEKAAGLIKEGRSIASESNLITALEVTMNAVGEIVDIKIKGASGVKELDDAAISSFNEAGPFPNPPKGLMENGLVKIEWGFVVQTSQAYFN